MPFKSQAQRRKFQQLVEEGKISEATYQEWEKHTQKKGLPERAPKKDPTRIQTVKKVKVLK